MNKTFLLVASAPYTSGIILAVADSLEEIKEYFMHFYRAKKAALRNCEFYNKEIREETEGSQWHEFCVDHDKQEKNFIKQYKQDNPGFIDVPSTGCVYDETGFFIKDIIIVQDSPEGNSDHWYVSKIFNSDLPKGIHCIEDYCA